MRILIVLITAALFANPLVAQKKKKSKNSNNQTDQAYNSSTFSALKFRNVGPALTAGRIADIAVSPENTNEYYLAIASGGVFKTTNNGTTFTPIFDNYGSYSIGCITIDPNNSNVIWVGTGENNNQRSVAYGDGVYKSLDGGKSFKKMGLDKSEHIGMIQVHPKNSNVVYVAAYGPLWSSRGERGLYKTINGGEDWELILELDEHTGVNEVHLDPIDPNVIYATAHQRRRHVFTYVSGGPGSGIHKSEDGGKTWIEINNGLPAKRGRIGMCISPVNNNLLYAIAEGEGKTGGFFKSTDRGASWVKMNDYKTSGNYYQELVPDPVNEDKVFMMDTWLHHTVNGGKTIVKTGETDKHVDNHCMWIDPTHTDHWLIGCDGGLYETFDHANTYEYKANLPITQFYKVAVDNAKPFYNIYGGTQDNNSIGGPSRTINNHGIMNQDWFITNGGDGFESAIDPENPNIVYAQSQYGWLVRYNKKTGEKVGIKPQAKVGESALRWNWDAPLIISPHDAKTLYFAANKLFKSTDRGNTWQTISPDLSQQIDRNQLKVMGRVQSVDAIMKNKSTTIYGNIVALDESPLQKGLIYCGTDDGLIQVTDDDGKNWKKIESFPDVPKNTYVNALVCSKHKANTVFAVFNNHKNGDFKPYILKSTDKGATWSSITGNLPERGSVYDVEQDHVNQSLLFAGTEFGVFTSINAGKNWTQLTGGIPTIAARDLEIQKRENDLVVASFGRGFYVLDNYSPLGYFKEEMMNEKAHLFPIKDALMFIDARPLGLRGKGSQGSNFFTTPNPEIGAVFTLLFNDTTKTTKELRQENEKDLIKDGKDVAYPNYDALKIEDTEEKPFLLYIIYDGDKRPIRKIKKDLSYGMTRVVWDFRYAPKTPVKLSDKAAGRYGEKTQGPLALPGTYYVSVDKVHNAEVERLVNPTAFNCKWLSDTNEPYVADANSLEFQKKVEKLRSALGSTQKYLSYMNDRKKHIKAALVKVPEADLNLLPEIKAIEKQLDEISIKLYGDRTLSSRDVEETNTISGNVGTIVWNMWRTRSTFTETNKQMYEDAGAELEKVLASLKSVDGKLENIEKTLDDNAVPYTPGRYNIPDWKTE